MYYLDSTKNKGGNKMRYIKLKLFVKHFNNDRVYYDPKFQRRKVWQSYNKNKFLESLTLDRLVNPIAVVEVDSCLKFSEELRDQNSIEYFGQLRNEGYKYVSIDGQNRTKFLIEFMNNECGVQGSFKDADDNMKKYKCLFLYSLAFLTELRTNT